MNNGCFLGIDTSNYTTSAALFKDGAVLHSKKLLPVAEGQAGLRQSDAVFHHVRQLPEVLAPFLQEKPLAVGVSEAPRSVPGSYMPCFLAGITAAKLLSGSLGVPLYGYAHQQGHLAAALFSCRRLDLLEGDFIAFHLSGGTSEGLLVRGGVTGEIQILAKALDLNAGQAVDRVGVLLGLPFPCGRHLEQLALACTEPIKIKPSMKGADFSLSGVQNKCEKLLRDGAPHSYIAAYCLTCIISAVEVSAGVLQANYAGLPMVFSGGVSSNSIMREQLTKKYNAHFAAPELSADNAAGPAILAARQYKKGV